MAMRIQRAHIYEFARAHGYEVRTTIAATLTNRDRHFAETPEFRNAVEMAAKVGGPVIIGNMLALLAATDLKRLGDALLSSLEAGVTVVDAVAEAVIEPPDIPRLIRHSAVIAKGRRIPIKRGLTRSAKVRVTTPANQAMAARGSSKVADDFAMRIKLVVDEIRGKLPAGSGLGPTLLARELNARGVLARKGGSWSATTARDLLLRLNGILPSPAEPHR